MDHNISLITTVAAGFGIALILGFIAERIRLPALVGYLLAGIIIGPHTPGCVGDVHIASQLSEIGVMLLMFGVGLHFSLDDLMVVRRIAVPGAVVQMSVATLLGMGVTNVVAEQNRELRESRRKVGRAAVSGDASGPAVLIQAHVANAAMLVIATPDLINVRQMVDTARKLNPSIEIVLRTHSEDESQLLRKGNVGTVFYGEEELACGITAHVLDRVRAAGAGHGRRHDHDHSGLRLRQLGALGVSASAPLRCASPWRGESRRDCATRGCRAGREFGRA